MSNSIEHVIVLMLENRSFDHALGYLKAQMPGLDGLDGTQSNPDVNGQERPTTPDAGYRDPPVDAGHECTDVLFQLFGSHTPAPDVEPTNRWFIQNYASLTNAKPLDVMRCFTPSTLPTLNQLAREFVVCDHWYSSVPGPTWPNRLFAHAATSGGYVVHKQKLYGMRTIYQNLVAAKRSVGIYAGDIPQSLLLSHLLTMPGLFHGMEAFYASLKKKGKLPNYVFIEPDYFGDNANDEHPPHDVAAGEYLIANVYEALRASSYWLSSVLIVLYDEHGGLYDHVPPPTTVNPDGKTSTKPPFDFTRLGVRVPAIIISPYVSKGQIDSRPFDHTSLLATAKAIFGLPKFLTKRDKQAQRFDDLLALAQPPRTDTPERLARPPLAKKLPTQQPRPLSDLQRNLLDLAELVDARTAKGVRGRAVAKGKAALATVGDERAAKPYVQGVFARYLRTNTGGAAQGTKRKKAMQIKAKRAKTKKASKAKGVKGKRARRAPLRSR